MLLLLDLRRKLSDVENAHELRNEQLLRILMFRLTNRALHVRRGQVVAADVFQLCFER